MKKRLGKLLAVSLAMLMLVSIIPLAAFADTGDNGGAGGGEKVATSTDLTIYVDETFDPTFGSDHRIEDGSAVDESLLSQATAAAEEKLDGETFKWYFYYGAGNVAGASEYLGNAFSINDPSIGVYLFPKTGDGSTGSNPEGLVTVTFVGLDENGDQYTETDAKYERVFAPGGQASDPGTPSRKPSSANIFLGWFEAAEGSDEDAPFDFDTTITESKTLYARWSDKYAVYFMDVPVDGQPDLVLKTVLVQGGGSVSASEAPSISAAPQGYVVKGWTEDGTSEFSFDSEINKNTTLRPLLVEGYTIHFVSFGTPVATQYVADGELVRKPADPTRSGYTFSKWVTKAEGTGDEREFNFTTPPTSSLILYGTWTATAVNYTISYWYEKANLPADADLRNPANYEQIGSRTTTATAGTTVQITSRNHNDQTYRYGDGTNSYLYKRGDFYNSPAVEILGNGTSVVNVYYTRKLYTQTFNIGKPGVTMTWGGKDYTGSEYKFTAKFESDISKLWPYDDGSMGETSIFSGTSQKFTGWQQSDVTNVSKRLVLTEDLAGKTLTGRWNSDPATVTLHYLFECFPSERNDADVISFSGHYYKENSTYTQTMYNDGINRFQLKDIDGMEKNGDVIGVKHYAYGKSGDSYVAIPDGAAEQYLFYNRTSGTMTYNVMSPPVGANYTNESKTLMFEEPLFEYSQTSIEEHPLFDGWFKNVEDMGDPSKSFVVDPSEMTMPIGDFTLYAKWLVGDYTVNFYRTEDTSELVGSDVVEEGNAVSGIPSTPAVGDVDLDTGMVFTGWFYKLDNTLIRFAFDMPIYSDMDVHGVWRDAGFKVYYEKGTSTSSSAVPVDSNEYKLTAMAQAADPGTSLNYKRSNTNYYFLYWLGSDGKYYYPGDMILMTEDITLTAQFYSGKTTKLTYDPNYTGAAEDGNKAFTETVPRNTEIILRGEGTFTRPGYVLVGWRYKNATTGTKYGLGAKYTTRNSSDDYTMYAQWEAAVTHEVTFEVINGVFTNADNPSNHNVVDGYTLNRAGITVPTHAEGSETGYTYTFEGWYENYGQNGEKKLENGPSTITPITGDVTYTAVYSKVATSVTVTFQYLEVDDSLITTDVQTVAVGDVWGVDVTITVPTPPPYTDTQKFTGWKVDNDSYAPEPIDNTGSAINDNLLFEALYKDLATDLKLTFITNPLDGSYGMLKIGEADPVQNTEYEGFTESKEIGSRAWPTAVPADTGNGSRYVFAGWRVQGETDYLTTSETFDANDFVIYENTTIEAVFTAVAVNTVSFAAGENGTLAGGNKLFVVDTGDEWDTSVILVPGDDQPTPIDEYEFSHWVGPDGLEYADKQAIETAFEGLEITEDLVFTAIFSAIPKFTITFESEGPGELAGETEYLDLLRDTTWGDEPVLVPTANPDTDAWFVGWFDEDDAPVTFPEDTSGIKITENRTFTAKFSPKTPVGDGETKLVAPSDSKVYDGKELTAGYTPNTGNLTGITGLAEGHAIVASSIVMTEDSKITDVGDVANVIDQTKIKVIDTANGNADVTERYTFNTVNGMLSVTKIRFAIVAADDLDNEYSGIETKYDADVSLQKVNDGGESTGDIYTLPEGFSLSADPATSATAKNVGNYDFELDDNIVLMEGDAPANTDNYEIFFEDGVLEIVKAPLTLTAVNGSVLRGEKPSALTYIPTGLKGDDIKERNGIELESASTALNDILDFVPALGTGYSVPDAMAEAGYDIFFTGDTKAAAEAYNGVNTNNYEVELVDSLITTEGGGLIVTDSYKVTYFANNTTATGKVPEDTTNYALNESATVLGNVGNPILTAPGLELIGWNTQKDGKGETYDLGVGTIKMTANVNLHGVWAITDSDDFALTGETEEYSGFDQTLTTLTGPFQAGDEITYTYDDGKTISYTYTGSNDLDAEGNVPTYIDVADTLGTKANVEVSIVRAGLTIELKDTVGITPVEATATWTLSETLYYNGKTQTVSLDDDSITFNFEKTAGDDVVTSNPLTGTGRYYEFLKFQFGGSKSTDANGTKVDLKINRGIKDATGNYIIKATAPKDYIRPLTLQISSDTAQWTYDGIERSSANYVTMNVTRNHASYGEIYGDGESGVVAALPFEGHQLNVTVDGKVTDVPSAPYYRGEYTVANTFDRTKTTLVDETGKDLLSAVNPSVKLQYIEGYLQMKPRPVTFTSDTHADNNITYDGLAHNVSGYSALPLGTENFGLVLDHKATNLSATTEDKIDVGTYTNTFNVAAEDVTIKNDKGDDKTHNYIVKLVEGNMVISKAKLTLAASSHSIPYNAVMPEVTISFKELLGRDANLSNKYDVITSGLNADGKITLVCTYTIGDGPATLAISFHPDHLPGGASELIAKNYDLTLEDGVLTVAGPGTTPTPTPTPTPPTDPTIPVVPAGPGAPGAPVAPVPPAPPTPDEPEPPTVIEDEPTPADAPAETADVVTDDVTPVAAPTGAWALLNLISAILCAVFAILLFITAFKRNKKKEQDEEAEAEMQAAAAANEEEDEDERNKKSGIGWRILSIILGVISPIVFLLTENIRLPMIFTDRWTLLMILLLVVQVIGMLLMRRARNQESDEDDEEAAAQA